MPCTVALTRDLPMIYGKLQDALSTGTLEFCAGPASLVPRAERICSNNRDDTVLPLLELEMLPFGLA